MPLNRFGYNTPKLGWDKGPRDVPKSEEEPNGVSCRWCNSPMYQYTETTHDIIMACRGHIRVNYPGREPVVEPCPNNIDEHKPYHWHPSKIDNGGSMYDRYLSVYAKKYDPPIDVRKVC